MSLEPSPSSPPSAAQHTHYQSRSRHHASSVWLVPLNINPGSDCKIWHNGGKYCRWKLPPPGSSKQQLQAHQAWKTSAWLRIFKPKFEKQLHARQNVLQCLSTSQGEHNQKATAPKRRKAQIQAYLEAVKQHLGHSKPNSHTRKPFNQ